MVFLCIKTHIRYSALHSSAALHRYAWAEAITHCWRERENENQKNFRMESMSWRACFKHFETHQRLCKPKRCLNVENVSLSFRSVYIGKFWTYLIEAFISGEHTANFHCSRLSIWSINSRINFIYFDCHKLIAKNVTSN